MTHMAHKQQVPGYTRHDRLYLQQDMLAVFVQMLEARRSLAKQTRHCR
jgi:hypothetical protein